MNRKIFYFIMLAALLIETTQILFIIKYLDWFAAHGIEFIYPILFSMSVIGFCALTYCLIRGTKSLFRGYARKKYSPNINPHNL